jgi:MFS family permease
MFAFSVILGRLADRWGREHVILIGVGTLILACIAAPLSPNVVPLAAALFLLGLGWNFCYVGGSSLLSDHLMPAEKAQAQGFNELLIGLASAAGSIGSGFIFAALGYAFLGIIGDLLSILPMLLTIRWFMSKSRLGLAN